ncbi:unnamed protein product [Ectocarpus fasciculatus]
MRVPPAAQRPKTLETNQQINVCFLSHMGMRLVHRRAGSTRQPGEFRTRLHQEYMIHMWFPKKEIVSRTQTHMYINQQEYTMTTTTYQQQNQRQQQQKPRIAHNKLKTNNSLPFSHAP